MCSQIHTVYERFEHPKPCKRTGYIHSIICQRGASTIGDLEIATLLGKPRTTERWRSRVSQPTPYKKRMHPSFVGNPRNSNLLYLTFKVTSLELFKEG